VKSKRLAAYCVAHEYDLRAIASYFGNRIIAIYNSVIGCKCIRDFNHVLMSNLDQYKFIVILIFI
jgi:hypothetical protein